MTASFTTHQLSGNRVLVNGTDSRGTINEVVLDGAQWAEVQATELFKKAEADYDATVAAFFEPITGAADKLTAAIAGPAEDPIFSVLLEEGEEGVAAKPERRLHLTQDSVVLRLLEAGQAGWDRLIWVKDQLEVLAPAAPAQP